MSRTIRNESRAPRVKRSARNYPRRHVPARLTRAMLRALESVNRSL